MINLGFVRKDSPVWGDGVITSLHVYGEERYEVIEEARRCAPDHPISGCRRAAEILFAWVEKFGIPAGSVEIGEYGGPGGPGKITAWVEKLADYYNGSYYSARVFRVTQTNAAQLWHVIVNNPRQHESTWIAEEIRRTRKALSAN
jgi:hypothetical protein